LADLETLQKRLANDGRKAKSSKEMAFVVDTYYKVEKYLQE
jgi:hypothetical protein